MILVLGGNGFVGSAYGRYLDQIGKPYRVVTRDNYKDYVGSSCDLLINANGNSKKYLAKDDPKSEFQASVVSVRNSLVDFKFRKYLFLSTSDVYPDCSSVSLTEEHLPIDVRQQSPYGFHKYVAELCVQHAAADWLIIRQGGFVGNGMKKNAVYDVLYAEKLWVHPDSEFQFMNTDDSARSIIALVDQGVSNQIMNLTATGTIAVREIMEIAGRRIPWAPESKEVRYEISTRKASDYVRLPSTPESVRSFISSLQMR